MKQTIVKDIMIPVSGTLSPGNTLYDVFKLFDQKRADTGHVQSDAVVTAPDGSFMGLVSVIDIFRALEPNYKKLFRNFQGHAMTREDLISQVRDFDLWSEPIKSLCERGAGIRVVDLMHIPDPHDCLQEGDSVEKAMHAAVMGARQPLVVKDGNRVTGLLRFEALFEVVHEQMRTCTIQD